MRGEERIKGPYQIPVSSINKRSRLGALAHAAKANEWEVYIYECVNYSGDILQKNGNVKQGKEETYTWTVGKKFIDGKWYVFKYSELINKVNGYWIDYPLIKDFVNGYIDAADILETRHATLPSGD